MRILLAEDDIPVRDVLVRGLEENGYVLDAVERGDDALHMLRLYEYAAAIIDWRMPGLPGDEVVRESRRLGIPTPMLMLTARDALNDRVHGLDAGADDYLVKPFDFGELLARLRALLRRGPVERPLVVAIGDLRIDSATRIVTRAGEEIELTAREYDVLAFLARQPGRVVTRSELLDEIWDDYDGSPNIIDVYVGYLRKKLGRALIRTVRGSGFVLEAP